MSNYKTRDSQIYSSLKSKGPIAKAIEHARASLQEPSRPITPASYDNRITNININTNNYNINKKTNNKSSLISLDTVIDTQNPMKLICYDIKDIVISINNEIQINNNNNNNNNNELLVQRLKQLIDEFLKYIKRNRINNDVSKDFIPFINEVSNQLIKTIHSINVSTESITLISTILIITLSIDLTIIQIESNNLSTYRSIVYVFQQLNDIITNHLSIIPNDLLIQLIDQLILYISIFWTKFPIEISNQSNDFAILLDGLIYVSGIIRFLTTNETNIKRLITINLVHIYTNSLSILLSYYSSNRDHSLTNHKQFTNLLTLLTITLRNISLTTIGLKELENHSTAPILCHLLLFFRSDSDLQLSILRVLGKLSLSEQCRSQIKSKSIYIKCIVQVLIDEAIASQLLTDNNKISSSNIYIDSQLDNKLDSKIFREIDSKLDSKIDSQLSNQIDSQIDSKADSKISKQVDSNKWQKWPIINRATFALVNLTTSNVSNRRLIGLQYKCLKPVVVLLEACNHSLDRLFTNTSNDFEDTIIESSDNKELVDATIKLLRLLANLSIDSEIGQIFASKSETIQMLSGLLSKCVNTKYEELLLNVIASCTNITYYLCNNKSNISKDKAVDSKANNYIGNQMIEISSHLVDCLFHDNDEIVLESVRALGNITRNEFIVPAIQSQQLCDQLISLLGHGDNDVVIAVTGVLVNISCESSGRNILLDLTVNVFDPLIDLLIQAKFECLELSILICQTIYNLVNIPSSDPNKERFSSMIPIILIDTLVCLSDYAVKVVSKQADVNENMSSYNEFIRVTQLVIQLLQ